MKDTTIDLLGIITSCLLGLSIGHIVVYIGFPWYFQYDWPIVLLMLVVSMTGGYCLGRVVHELVNKIERKNGRTYDKAREHR